MLLRGLVKLALVAVAAGGAGLLLGLGASAFSGGGGPPAAAGGAPTTGQAGLGGAGTSSRPPAASPQPVPQIQVSLVSAVLQPAATAQGRQRQRARLIVRVRARNGGNVRVTPGRPTLQAAGITQHTDPHADATNPGLGSLRPGQTKLATLVFEVAGAVTAELTTGRGARVVVAGHSLSPAVTLGPPV